MPTVVIGAGQAGLAVSRALRELSVEHVVLEQAQVAQAWRDRWDSFTLVTPNWTLNLPGSPYAGDDPEGHVRSTRPTPSLTPVRAAVRPESGNDGEHHLHVTLRTRVGA